VAGLVQESRGYDDADSPDHDNDQDPRHLVPLPRKTPAPSRNLCDVKAPVYGQILTNLVRGVETRSP
jgi:hypothetical protein